MVYPIHPEVVKVSDDVGVRFEYVIGGVQQSFIASRDVLESHFDLHLAAVAAEARDQVVLEAFSRGWDRIKNAAARDRRVPSSVPIVLMASDISV